MAGPAPSNKPQAVLRPGAAVLAWLWPGLGHISIGEKKRGVLIMIGVLFLFFGGLLVGGLDSIDRRNDRLWYLAQAMCGPVAIVADVVNQAVVQTVPSDFRRGTRARTVYSNPNIDDHEVLTGQLRRIGLGHVNEMGTLFIALAGLMNLVVVLDALYFVPRHKPERRRGPHTA